MTLCVPPTLISRAQSGRSSDSKPVAESLGMIKAKCTTTSWSRTAAATSPGLRRSPHTTSIRSPYLRAFLSLAFVLRSKHRTR
jgi:hypothetical protein